MTSAYVSYQITNTDGVNYADVWAAIGNFTVASGSPVMTLAANAASSIDLGPLANGQTKTAFFYLGSSGTWGGHIASQLDWGPGNGAGTISGFPYHMRQRAFSGPGARNPGNQELSLAGSAVTFPTIIVVNKAAVPTLASENFNFTNTSKVFFERVRPTTSSIASASTAATR